MGGKKAKSSEQKSKSRKHKKSTKQSSKSKERKEKRPKSSYKSSSTASTYSIINASEDLVPFASSLTNTKPAARGTVVKPSPPIPAKVSASELPPDLLDPVQIRLLAKRIAEAYAKLIPGSTLIGASCSYNIIKETGARSFGFTYDVIHKESQRKLRMKTEPFVESSSLEQFKSLRNELNLLRHIDEGEKMHSPVLFDCGLLGTLKYMLTFPFGDSIYTLLKAQKTRSFSKTTTVRVSLQMFRAIRDLHNLGYVHRSLKLQVFAIGVGDRNRSIYMTDFDTVSKFTLENGRHIPLGSQQNLLVNRYSSRFMHRNLTISRRDDLEAWLYMSLELFNPWSLSWRDESDPTTMWRQKTTFVNSPDPHVFQKESFPQYGRFLDHITKLAFDETPNYYMIFEMLKNICQSTKSWTLEYDWERSKEDTLMAELSSPNVVQKAQAHIEVKKPVVSNVEEPEKKESTSDESESKSDSDSQK